ncbi:ras and EF-hand domain-containing protein-like isoform X2 [Acipenser oxyrinchus oxyrinchus]|uniref:Ras and EF-hand domain-containing protein-like isoform X2 n=1 Tax=Acipenser oxyrinchus oxyrinchus TaxID=40147 RepID=A0AAD8GI97_ACIOX|nr:ras and EF-hand domain-containing protein-like isoform X2 [Acipenser oxyrinchus oxyrinchus]
MEDEEDLDRLRLLFHACDANNSGSIEKEEFFSVCAELKVHPAEIECIFTKLDVDRDGSINFEEFANGFEGVSDLIDLGRMESDNDGHNFRQAWEAFQQRLGEEAKFIPRNEQVATLYQNINLTEPRLVYHYERVVMNFIREIKLQNSEMENLALAVKRAQDKAAMQLSEMEEEMDQRIQASENKIRQEETRKAEAALGDIKRQCDSEVCELQVKMKKLKMIEEQYKHINLKDEVVGLKRKINELTLEKQQLKRELLESQTNIAFLQSELDSLKCEYTDQSIILEQDKAMIKDYTDERDYLTRQIEILQSANRKLHDSNDGLRSTLENSLSKYNKSMHVYNTSPGNTISQSSPKFSGRQSPFYDRSSHSSYMDEDCDMLAMCDPMCRVSCEVESLAESCLDSGLSTLRDSNDYDSEVEFRLQKNLQMSHKMPENFGGDASDTDVPEIHDEVAYSSDGNSSALDWKPPTPISRRDSSASVLTRKCISAISPQADNRDSNSKYPHSEKAYKVVLAGDAAVGKSSFLLRLCKNEFHGNTSATLGVDFQMKTLVVDGEPIVLQLWDTAGQERFRSIAKSYFRRADGVLLLYDVTYEKSLLNIQEWVDMIEDVSQGEIPIMLVGNKADLREQAIEEGIKCIPTSYGERLAMAYNALFCETSAKDGSNVIEAVLHLARDVKKRSNKEEDLESVTNLSGVDSKKPTNMKTCCTV